MMADTKEEQYRKLVEKRKSCRACESSGLINPSTLMINGNPIDSREIDAWALWQNSLDADILLIGQEWGDVNGFKQQFGKNLNNSDTDKNLIKLFKIIGVEVLSPNSGIKNPRLFFTNAALCLKMNGGAQGQTNETWYHNCQMYIKELIEIIKPRIIIILGVHAYDSIAEMYGLEVNNNGKFSNIIEKSKDGFEIFIDNKSKAMLFPVYHPARRIINLGNKYEGKRYRSWEQMIEDWKRIDIKK